MEIRNYQISGLIYIKVVRYLMDRYKKILNSEVLKNLLKKRFFNSENMPPLAQGGIHGKCV